MENKVIDIVKEACALKENIAPDSELRLLSLDSLSFIGIIVKLEETFNVEFEIDELNILNWKTINDIVENIQEKIDVKI